MTFFGIEYEDSNIKHIQKLFYSNPIPEKEGYPPSFLPVDITDKDIDHSLRFTLEELRVHDSYGYGYYRG